MNNKYGKRCFECKKWLFFHEIVEGLFLYNRFYQYDGEGWFRYCPTDDESVLESDVTIIDAIKASGLSEIQATMANDDGIGHIIACKKCIKKIAKREGIHL